MGCLCDHCVYCLFLDKEDTMVHCTNIKLLEDNVGCLNLFQGRAREERRGYYKVELQTVSRGCDYFLDILDRSVPVPEPILVHNPVNWQDFKEIRDDR